MHLKIFGRDLVINPNHFLSTPSLEKNTFDVQYIPDKSLTDEVIFLTGGSRGIGFSIAEKLSNLGAKVIISGRDEAMLKKATNKIGKDNNVFYYVIDISRIEEREIVRDITSIFGPISILINNAGVTGINNRRKNWLLAEERDFDYVFNINVNGYLKLMYVFSKYFEEHDINGKILNIISNTALIPAIDSYNLSKVVIKEIIKEFAVYYHGKIAINGIMPEPVKTDMSWNLNDSLVFWDAYNGRFALPEEIAALAIWILTRDTDYTGQTICCDGGQHLK